MHDDLYLDPEFSWFTHRYTKKIVNRRADFNRGINPGGQALNPWVIILSSSLSPLNWAHFLLSPWSSPIEKTVLHLPWALHYAVNRSRPIGQHLNRHIVIVIPSPIPSSNCAHATSDKSRRTKHIVQSSPISYECLITSKYARIPSSFVYGPARDEQSKRQCCPIKSLPVDRTFASAFANRRPDGRILRAG